MIELRPYQREAVEAIRSRLAAGKRRLLVALPTGTGKTVVFAHLPSALELRGRWLVLAHREELLDQAATKMRAANPGLTVEVEQADRRAGAADVVIASVPTLQRARLAALDPVDFAAVVVDEAHHAVAETYGRIFDHFGLLELGCPRPLLGFTATPSGRADGQGLAEVFEEIAYQAGLREMIEAGYLCGLTGWRIRTNLDLSGVGWRAGDFVAGELERAVDCDSRNRLVVRAYQEHAAGRRALAFGVGVAHAQHLAEAFRAAGVPAAFLSGETPKDERRALLARFATGELQVLANCAVLTEGFDDPGVACILMARPTGSSLLYTQIIGRGTRLAVGKRDCIVIDLTDASSRHSLASLASLFGLPGEMNLAGHDAIETKAEVEDLLERCPWVDYSGVQEVAELETVAERIEFFQQTTPADLAGASHLAWMKVADGAFRLPLPNGERLEVEQSILGPWQVSFVEAGKEPTPIAERPTLPEAIQAADAAVRLRRAAALAVLDTRRAWRRDPASPKQLALLRRMHMPTPEGLTKGGAAAMLTWAFERRTTRRAG